MNLKIILLASILIALSTASEDTRPYNLPSLYQAVYENFIKYFVTEDDRFKTIKEIVEAQGYIFEEHKIWTDDGYQLTLHRIRHKNKYFKAPPVLFQHGIEDSSYEWIVNSADRAPAFALAHAGFDVWLGNNRGNHFSRKHKYFRNTENLFWQLVDFEEMGIHDVPAEIDYILNYTEG